LRRKPSLDLFVAEDPLATLFLCGIVLFLSDCAEVFMVPNDGSSGNPLYHEHVPLLGSSSLGMLELLKDLQPVRLIVLDMNLVCMALYDFFLSLHVAKEMLKPAFEILP
jgi:hypothetical protein